VVRVLHQVILIALVSYQLLSDEMKRILRHRIKELTMEKVYDYKRNLDETSVHWYPAPTDNPLEKLSIHVESCRAVDAINMLMDVKAYSPNLKACSVEIKHNLFMHGEFFPEGDCEPVSY
jgi:hypothetical protein